MAEFRLDIVGNTEGLTDSLAEAAKGLQTLGNEAVKTGQKTKQAFDGGGEKAAKNLKDQVLLLARLEQELKKTLAAKKQAFNPDDVKKYDTELKKTTDSLIKLDSEISKVDDSSKSLKSQLRENKEILSQMESQGLETTETFIKLSIATGKLQDQIGDTNERIKFFASDTRGLDGLIGVTKLATAGFGIAQGAAAIFGAENENVQKALLRVNAAMAILNGLQEIQQALQKSSAARITLETIARKVKVFVLGEETAATTTLTVAQNAAAVAAKVLRAALLATGVGAFVFLITQIVSAVSAMNDFKEGTESTTEAIKKQDEALQGLQKTLEFNNDKQLANAKRLGANQETLNAIESQGRKDNLDALAKDIEIKRQILERADANRLKAFTDGNNDEKKKALEDFQEARAALNDSLTARTEALRDFALFKIDSQTKSNEELAKNNKTFDDNQEAERKKQEEIRKNALRENNANRIALMDEGFAKEKAKLDEQQRIELQDAKTKQLDLLLLRAKFAKEQTDLKLSFDKKELESSQKLAADQKKLEEDTFNEFIKSELDYISNLEQLKLIEKDIEFESGNKSIAEAKRIAEEKLQIEIEAAKQRIELLSADNEDGSNDAAIARLKLAIQKANNEIKAIGEATPQDNLFKALGLGDLDKDQQQTVINDLNVIASSVKQIFSEINQAALDANSKVLSSLDSQISSTQSNLDKQEQLAAEGRSNNLEAEKQNLIELEAAKADAIERQKKLQRQQLNIDTATQISSLITASANIFASTSKIPVIGVGLAIAAIASMFAAFAVTQIKARQAISQQTFAKGGIVEGKRHSQGGEKYYSESGNLVEIEQGEHVTKRSQTDKYRALLNAINNDTLKQMNLSDLLSHTGVTLSKEKIEGYKQAVNSNEISEIKYKLELTKDPEIKGLRQDFNKYVSDEKDKPVISVVGNYMIITKGNKTSRIKL